MQKRQRPQGANLETFETLGRSPIILNSQFSIPKGWRGWLTLGGCFNAKRDFLILRKGGEAQRPLAQAPQAGWRGGFVWTAAWRGLAWGWGFVDVT